VSSPSGLGVVRDVRDRDHVRCPDRADAAFTKGSSTGVGSGTWPRKRLPHKRSFTRPILVHFGRSWDWGPRTTSSLSASTTLDDDQVAAIVSAFGTFGPRQLDDEAQIEIRRAWRIAHLCGGARVRATRWKGRADDCDNGEQCMPSSETAARGQFSAILGLGRFELA